jgi:glycerophosphoryl diester phosphodiesterase
MQIFGHRGARGLAPENTLVSIEQALKVGVDWVEFDVRRTQDGRLIILHDNHTGRIAKNKRRAKRASYQQLLELQTHSGEPIPLLVEVLKLIGHKAKINIEIKTPGCAEQVAKAIEVMVASGYAYDHFMVSSFYPNILFEIKKYNQQIPLALLELHLSVSLLISRKLNLKAVGLYHHTISKMAVRLAKHFGLFVYAHTVNDPKEASHLQKIGVDAIVTDYPDRFTASRVARDNAESSKQK